MLPEFRGAAQRRDIHVFSILILLIFAALTAGGCVGRYSLHGPSAHRGVTSDAPDNSEAAIMAAIKYGIPLIEVDVRRDRDGTMWLFHDNTVQQADQRHLVGRQFHDLGTAEVSALTVRGQKIIQPVTLFNLIRSSTIVVQLDLKDESAETIGEIIRLAKGKNVSRQIVIQCQKEECRNIMSTSFREIKWLARVDAPAHFDPVLKTHPDIIQVDRSEFLEVQTTMAHKEGVAILVKVTGDDVPFQWCWLAGRGVDIILTDKAPSAMPVFERCYRPE